MHTPFDDRWPTRIRDALPREALGDEEAIVRAVARRFHLGVADLRTASNNARLLVPERWARRCRVLPLDADDAEVTLATADPLDLDCERTLAFATGRTVRFAIAGPAALDRAIDAVYGEEHTLRSHTPRVNVDVQILSNEHETAPPTAADDSATTITHLVDELLAEGVAAHASDLHIEPEEGGIAVRQRVDGVLRHVRMLPRVLAPSLVSRIKILSGLNIADRLRPQDGRARVAVNGSALDLRVSTLPASHGEKVVIRLLDGRATVLSLERMGLHAREYERIDSLLLCREGLILVTGPTGSGKTTTLYAALRRLQKRGVNIVTVEDPIEYRIPGIVQVQVHERAGLTFASALRSIMRQDPDVLLIGEIRDRETAEIAIQASLTGHLVLSTMHTNDAASAITRLADIGVAGFKIATAVKGVIAQRLVRRLCACGAAAADQSMPSQVAVAERTPCESCTGEGYRGRLAIVEVLIASPEFERGVAAGEPVDRLAVAARESGMRSLWESGMDHVHAGDTSVAELLRVAAPPADAPPRHLPVDASLAVGYLKGARRTAQQTLRGRPSLSTSPISIDVGTVEVYMIHPQAAGWRILMLQRATGTPVPRFMGGGGWRH